LPSSTGCAGGRRLSCPTSTGPQVRFPSVVCLPLSLTRPCPNSSAPPHSPTRPDAQVSSGYWPLAQWRSPRQASRCWKSLKRPASPSGRRPGSTPPSSAAWRGRWRISPRRRSASEKWRAGRCAGWTSMGWSPRRRCCRSSCAPTPSLATIGRCGGPWSRCARGGCRSAPSSTRCSSRRSGRAAAACGRWRTRCGPWRRRGWCPTKGSTWRCWGRTLRRAI